jgi:hypothetical protein
VTVKLPAEDEVTVSVEVPDPFGVSVTVVGLTLAPLLTVDRLIVPPKL